MAAWNRLVPHLKLRPTTDPKFSTSAPKSPAEAQRDAIVAQLLGQTDTGGAGPGDSGAPSSVTGVGDSSVAGLGDPGTAPSAAPPGPG